MSTLSTHILDTTTGQPAAGVKVAHSVGGKLVASGVTNNDGRVSDLLDGQPITPGNHTLTFEVGPYFATNNRETFFSNINVDFVVTDINRNYHIPLLLSPFSFTSYRGS
ncbi:MAG: hydroxyisourate hydrolase [Actinomycetes bacterium]|jgi:5-hydroxyisourate hydrolase